MTRLSKTDGAPTAPVTEAANSPPPPLVASELRPTLPNCDTPPCVPANDPVSPPGVCATALTLKLTAAGLPERLGVSGSNEAALDTSQSTLGGCRGATGGPDVWYELDLSAARAVVEVRAVLDADFDAALDLRRGPCGDSLSLDCDRASAVGRPSSALYAQLEPGSYWLVVSGRDAASRGRFQLQLELNAPLDACLTPDPAIACDGAPRLDTRELQTVLPNIHCPPPSDDASSFYYELDLGAESAPVLVTVSSWGLSGMRWGSYLLLHRADAGASDCGSPLAGGWIPSGSAQPSDAVLNASLPPGRYFVELSTDRLDAEERPSPVALTVRLDRQTCRDGPQGDSCETALELDSTPGLHIVDGATYCNSDQLTLEACEDVAAPEQLHRLDLRAETGPTQVRLGLSPEGIDFYPLLYVLAANEAGGCGEGLYCFDALGSFEGLPDYELTLEPNVYFVGVDGGYPGSAGRYRLFVELAPSEPSPCIDAEIDDCVYRNDLTYCCGDSTSPLCAELIAMCGLAGATQACVCEANAACCGAEGDRSGCAKIFSDCSYLCPDFAPSQSACIDVYR